LVEVISPQQSNGRRRGGRRELSEVARLKNFFCCVDFLEAGFFPQDGPYRICECPFTQHPADWNRFAATGVDDRLREFPAATRLSQDGRPPGQTEDGAHLAVLFNVFEVAGIESGPETWAGRFQIPQQEHRRIGVLFEESAYSRNVRIVDGVNTRSIGHDGNSITYNPFMSTAWADVEQYLNQLFVPLDPALDAALQASDAAGLPSISVTPNQGKLLFLLARIQGARRILEIGTLGGYSTIWLARALPRDGRLMTLEMNATHAGVARDNIARAGLSDVVDLRVGKALDTLPHLTGPFDFVFIDADKPSYPEYWKWALALSRRGTVIVADNVVRNGAVCNAASNDPSVQGVRRFNELVAAEPRVSATAIQTVGTKGYDGFAMALVS
jgi:predicted O-methyltransferase YrrM